MTTWYIPQFTKLISEHDPKDINYFLILIFHRCNKSCQVSRIDFSFLSTKFFLSRLLLPALHFTPCSVLEQLLQHFDTLTKEEDGKKVKIKVKVSTKDNNRPSESGEGPSRSQESPTTDQGTNTLPTPSPRRPADLLGSAGDECRDKRCPHIPRT
jgi:hypothetical protein